MAEAANDSRMFPGWTGAYPCLVVLGTVLGGIATSWYLASALGEREEDRRQFMVNYRMPVSDEIRITVAVNYASNSSEFNEVLIHGDSTAKDDLDAESLEGQLGLTAYNIGTSAWLGWSGYTLLLERYLERHPRPRVVALCIHPYILTEESPGGSPYEDRFVWCYGPGNGSRPRHDSSTYYAVEGVRSLYGRLVPERIVSQKKFWGPHGEIPGGFTREWNPRRGSVLYDGESRFKCAPPNWNGTAITRKVLDHLKAMAALTRENDILFYVRLMPVWKGTTTLSDTVREQLKTLQDEYPNTFVGRPEIWEMESGHFWDDRHLNTVGADLATSRLAADIETIVKARGLKPERR